MKFNEAGGLAAQLVPGDTSSSPLSENQSRKVAIAARVLGTAAEFAVSSIPLGPISHMAAKAAGVVVEEAACSIGNALLKKFAVGKAQDTVQNDVHEKHAPH